MTLLEAQSTSYSSGTKKGKERNGICIFKASLLKAISAFQPYAAKLPKFLFMENVPLMYLGCNVITYVKNL